MSLVQAEQYKPPNPPESAGDLVVLVVRGRHAPRPARLWYWHENLDSTPGLDLFTVTGVEVFDEGWVRPTACRLRLSGKPDSVSLTAAVGHGNQHT
jgi:hypothetical protein